MPRAEGMSVRLKLAISYAGFLMVAGAGMLGVVWLFLLRYVPDNAITTDRGFAPNRSDLVRAFTPAVVVVLALLLLIGMLGGWFLAGRMLAPLAKITAATRSASEGSLSHRIELPGRNDEFHELADAFDAMLARLEAHVAEQRRFAANASHELRTPLAITQTLLEVAHNDPSRNTADLLTQLGAVNGRAIELTEALLLLSRADGGSFDRSDVDLSLVAEEATETLVGIADRHGVDIEVTGEVAHALGSQALLLQVATNLIHNAIVHNIPEHGSVRVGTHNRPHTVALVVENTGEVVSPELISTLTEPFQRGTARVHGDTAGVGLGLAIVASITAAHGGTLTIVGRPTGGLRVTVELPANRLRQSGNVGSPTR